MAGIITFTLNLWTNCQKKRQKQRQMQKGGAKQPKRQHSSNKQLTAAAAKRSRRATVTRRDNLHVRNYSCVVWVAGWAQVIQTQPLALTNSSHSCFLICDPAARATKGRLLDSVDSTLKLRSLLFQLQTGGTGKRGQRSREGWWILLLMLHKPFTQIGNLEDGGLERD